MTVNIQATHGTRVLLSSYFSAVAGATEYEFWSDNTLDGHLVIGGVLQDYSVAQPFSVSDFTSVQIDIGNSQSAVSDYFRAEVGGLWGAWQAFTVTALANTAPVATGSAPAANVIGTHWAFNSIFNISDADGDPTLFVDVYVGDGTTSHGHVYTNCMDLPHNVTVTLSWADYLRTDYDNTLDGTTNLWIRPNDGFSNGAWSSVVTMPTATAVMPTAHAPTVSYNGATLTAGVGTDNVGSKVLASFADVDGDTPKLFLLWDNGNGNGHLLDQGAVLGTSQNMEVTAAQMPGITYQATGAGGSVEHLNARAWDGTQWGPWKAFDEIAGAENDPTVSATGASTNLAIGLSVAASSLFTASDADGNATLVAYRFWDVDNAACSAYWTVADVAQHPGSWIDVPVADLSTVSLVAASTAGYSETMYISALDAMGHEAQTPVTLTVSSHE